MQSTFLLLCISLAALFCPVARAETFSFAQYGDIHLAGAGTPTTSLLNRLVAFLNDGPPAKAPVDFIVDTGDIHQSGEPMEVYPAYTNALARLNVPAYILRGNHDTAKDFEQAQWRQATGRDLQFSFVHKGVAFIGFDTAVSVPTWQKVSASERTLAWLAAEKEKIPPQMPVVLFTHVPLASSMGLPEAYPLINRNKVLDLFKGRKLLAVISGHFHGEKQSVEDGVLFTVTSSFSENRANHDGKKGGAVRIFTIRDDKIETRLVPFE